MNKISLLIYVLWLYLHLFLILYRLRLVRVCKTVENSGKPFQIRGIFMTLSVTGIRARPSEGQPDNPFAGIKNMVVAEIKST